MLCKSTHTNIISDRYNQYFLLHSFGHWWLTALYSLQILAERNCLRIGARRFDAEILSKSEGIWTRLSAYKTNHESRAHHRRPRILLQENYTRNYTGIGPSQRVHINLDVRARPKQPCKVVATKAKAKKKEGRSCIKYASSKMKESSVTQFVLEQVEKESQRKPLHTWV